MGYLFFRFFSRLPSPSIPCGQCMRILPGYSSGRPVAADRLSQSSAIKCPVPSDGLCPDLSPNLFRLPSNELPPFAFRQGFWLLPAPTNLVMGRPGFTLQSVTSFHRLGLHHYYGFICHLAPLRLILESPLGSIYPLTSRNDTRLPQLPLVPISYATLYHSTGLTRYRALRYFARLPTCEAETGSLALCAA
jgi:hypothetical protein